MCLNLQLQDPDPELDPVGVEYDKNNFGFPTLTAGTTG